MGFFDRIFNSIKQFIFSTSREDIRERAFEKREEERRDAELQRDFEKFREFQERTDIERAIEDDVGVRRKIIKSIWYDPTQPHRAGSGIKVYSLTYEDNSEDRFDELLDALSMGEDEVEQGLAEAPPMDNLPDRGNRAFVGFDWIQQTDWGYDDQLEVDDPPFEYPDIEVGIER